MIASKNLKKQIIIEIGALLFLVCVIIYAIYAIKKNNQNHINNNNGFVSVLDDSKFGDLQILSDGEGLNGNGVTITVTNNNDHQSMYQVVLIPSIEDEQLLNQIKVSVDDLYIENITDLEKKEDGYIIITHQLNSGFTKNHIIKLWYKRGTEPSFKNKKISFDYQLIT